jgi:hypothetical protein
MIEEAHFEEEIVVIIATIAIATVEIRSEIVTIAVVGTTVTLIATTEIAEETEVETEIETEIAIGTEEVSEIATVIETEDQAERTMTREVAAIEKMKAETITEEKIQRLMQIVPVAILMITKTAMQAAKVREKTNEVNTALFKIFYHYSLLSSILLFQFVLIFDS